MRKETLSYIRKVLIAIVCVISGVTPGFSQSSEQHNRDEKIAVLPLQTQDNLSVKESRDLTEWIIFKCFCLGYKNLLGLTEIDEALASNRGTNLENCFSDSCVYVTGAMLEVQRIIWGAIKSNGYTTTLFLYSGDVSQQKVMNTIEKEINGPITDLYTHIPEILDRLLNIHSISSQPSNANTEPVDQASVTHALALIEVNSIPPGAELIIDGTPAGMTPTQSDSLEPGLHEITLDLKGYKQFSKKLLIAEGAYKKYVVKLIKKFGCLTVFSTPPGASVTLNNNAMGTTPYTNDTLLPETYSLGLTLQEYQPYTGTTTIVRSQSDTVSVKLISLAYIDSVKQIKKHRRQIARKIVFGTITAGLCGAGMIYNNRVATSIDEEVVAYKRYSQPDLSAEEYEEYYQDYHRVVKETDSLSKKRNACYIIGGLSAIGFTLSIWF